MSPWALGEGNRTRRNRDQTGRIKTPLYNSAYSTGLSLELGGTVLGDEIKIQWVVLPHRHTSPTIAGVSILAPQIVEIASNNSIRNGDTQQKIGTHLGNPSR